MWDDDEKRRKDDDAINAVLVGAVFAGLFALIFSLFKNALRYPVATGVIILGLYGFSQYTAWQTAAAAESDDEGFALVFEAKITATLTHAQLTGHQRVSAKQGFDDVTFFTIVADSNAGDFDGWTELSWSNIYLWLRDKSSGSTWAKHAADYFEILEARMLEQSKLGNAEITAFDGFSSHEDGYSYLVAKSELRKAMQELRKDTDLVDALGMDPSNLGRGAITGKSEQRVWDYLAINSGFDSANFTDFMHLTLGLHFDGVEAMVTVPNGLATQPKNAMKALGLDGFRAICFEVLENLKPLLDDEPNAVPTMRSVQRRYPSQRSVPFWMQNLNSILELRSTLPTQRNTNRNGLMPCMMCSPTSGPTANSKSVWCLSTAVARA